MFKAKLSYFFHPVQNLKEAYNFFVNILGLELVYTNLTDITEDIIKQDIPEGLTWLELTDGNVKLLVQEVPNIKPYETGIGFYLGNCDESYVFLKNSGVEIVSHIQGVGKLRFFEIKDPTGSIFNIFGD
ncbi:MAG: hypothetical protein KatS3mg068_0544 [Candidatus Sericytochromatia bacterium]|nr:MAG: hypothetical protein KatS3mg068_0544 [Candidatus Sericytochromatia bacterium]